MNVTEKIFLISLGCAKNLVDSEQMLGILKSCGFETASNIEGAGIAIINTCGFIQTAVEESIDTILEAVTLKEQGKLSKVFVAGCFVQRYGYKLQREIPEVDGWLGTGEIHRVAEIIRLNNRGSTAPFFIGRPLYLADHTINRIQTDPFYSTYLKIAEGCSHRCSYCIIPGLRGPLRSRKLKSLVIEAERMADQGVVEINLIAQDTTIYGKDLEEDVCLEDLLEALLKIDGIRWLRLLYCHPGNISERLLDIMDSEDLLCPYLDIPLQHVNVDILRAMKRGLTKETPLELIQRIRSRTRKISIRTTLMVGFPGETDKKFKELYDFVKLSGFDHLGVFVFSREKGIPAARLKPTVPYKEAEVRKNIIMSLQKDILKRKNRQLVGHTLPVLIEGLCPETDLLLRGRTQTMAPDVDDQVLINKGEGVTGRIMPVLITDAHTYDLIGEIKDSP